MLNYVAACRQEVRGNFSPSAASLEEVKELRPGLRQIDGLLQVEEVLLGIRLFLQLKEGALKLKASIKPLSKGAPVTERALLLYFHGNAETVDTYKVNRGEF